MKNRCPALPALFTWVSLQISASAQQTDQWFGTIRPPLAPPIGEVQDRILPGGSYQDRFAVGDGFDSLTFSVTDVSFGANLLYYLRQDGTGSRSWRSPPRTSVTERTCSTTCEVPVTSPRPAFSGAWGCWGCSWRRGNGGGRWRGGVLLRWPWEGAEGGGLQKGRIWTLP